MLAGGIDKQHWAVMNISFLIKAFLEVNSEPWQTSEIVLFAKIVNGRQPLTIFAKSCIWQGSDYVFVFIKK